MNNFQVRTKTQKSTSYRYESDVVNTIVFLKSETDKICFRSATINEEITIYQDDELLFIGTKEDLFNLLKKPRD